ncbi:MAG: hypothetical protein K1X74_00285 [Pirellulales bacterium]|nr:hypothetical protein [Pirellulales bacterium]
MSSGRIDWNVLKNLSWWHWALTVPLLALHLAGYAWALLIATSLCALVGGYYLMLLQQLRPYPVQVRLAYLVLLVAGALPWMSWIYGVQLVGTTAMITVGYCPLLRLLSVAPWNRTEPLGRALLWQVFFREPCAGGLVRGSATSSAPFSACGVSRASHSPITCSLAGHSTSHWQKNARPSLIEQPAITVASGDTPMRHLQP